MQDNAPSHAAVATIKDLEERSVRLIYWPSFSPDLNPIERLWNIMKNWINTHYPNNHKTSYDTLRKQVREAWDAIREDTLEELIDTMQERCQDVIDAEGGHTKW